MPSLPPPMPAGSDGPPPIPQAERKAPPPGRKFPCKQCGAKLDYDPEARGLKCPYCGFTEVIAPADENTRAEEIKEHDLEEFLATQEEAAHATIGGHSSQVTCAGCGAVILLQDKVATDKCPYCNTHLENKPEEVKNLIAPESVLPFALSDRQARDSFNKWLSGLWFAPSELKQLANLGQFSSMYCPYWTYDAMTYTSYNGERGDDYTTTETYTDSDGKQQTRTVTHTSWRRVSGEVRHFFDDVLIRAAKTLPQHLADKLNPWALPSLEPYKDEYLSGHQAERYSVSLTDGYGEAKQVMRDHITGLINRDIGGDHQRIHWRQTQHNAVTFKHTLLPVWIANYRYREKLFQVLVNGESGKVAGDRPWSWFKILRLVFLILLAIVLAAVLVSKVRGSSAPAKPRASLQSVCANLPDFSEENSFCGPFVSTRC
ncbi:hypothetical protein [Zavarzinella formosa]|uniref:hypothetical protein n=1 Tax=Zavarzinella formosa TaxID=360055 RepID=UPI0002F00B01|nr:hypothetical protein [Zavarzinella formosa]